jgi:hypothetical protein
MYIIIITIIFLILLKIYDKKKSSKLIYISFIPIVFYIYQHYILLQPEVSIHVPVDLVKPQSSLTSLSSLISSI